jgi:NADH-quinone oxidoreductase subunit H
VLQSLILFAPTLLAVAFVTVYERKLLGALQRRVGPNTVGAFGLLQAFADALKLAVKEILVPSLMSRWSLYLVPVWFLAMAVLSFTVLPGLFGVALLDSSGGVLLLITWLSGMIYGTVYGGMGSANYFGTVGAIRAAAQIVSYELSFGSAVLAVVALGGSFSLPEIADAQGAVVWALPLLPLVFSFLVSLLAELNRTPFDLPEGESELVAGYMTEFSSVPFVLYFLGEYASLLLISLLAGVLWAGGAFLPLAGLAGVTFVVGIRGTLPRLRYDQLVTFGWLHLLPLTSVALLPVFLLCLV